MSVPVAGCAAGIPGAVRNATPADEQAWIAEQLSTQVREPKHTVWVYTDTAIVLGKSQRRVLPAPGLQLPILERVSGGGAVLVTPAVVGATVALPCGHPLAGPGLVNSYRWLGDLHAQALRRVGVSAATVAPGELARTSGSRQGDNIRWACFGGISPWEVVGRGRRKLVGLAQARRSTGTVLVAGTLVGRVDWSALAAGVGGSEAEAAQLAACTTSCEAELGWRLSPLSFAAVISEALFDLPHLR